MLFAHPPSGCITTEGHLQGRAAPGAPFQAINGSVVVAEGCAACTASARVLAATQAGALALIVASDSSNNGFPAPTTFAPPRGLAGQLPVGGVPRSTLLMPQRLATAAAPVLLQVDATSSGIRPDDVAAFSAFGPTDDSACRVGSIVSLYALMLSTGRIKPDILAVGDRVESASVPSESSNPGASCALFVRSGTSMAAPAIAGAIALLRQYFEDGYAFQQEPAPNASLGSTPSGALLKAVLLNGAVEMEGLSELGLPLELVPSFRQGWGLASVAQSVPLDDSMRLFVADNVSIATGETHRYCVDVGADARGGTLRATLVWYDTQASPAARRTLVNDLDLEVVPPKGGLGAAWGAAPRPDRTNTVERTGVPWLSAGRYEVVVQGHNVPVAAEDGVPYALAVTTSRGLGVWLCG